MMVNFSLRDPQKSFVFRYVKMCFMVAQTACLDQSSQDMEHSCGNDENRACRGPCNKMCVPQTERLVGFIGCLACIRFIWVHAYCIRRWQMPASGAWHIFQLV